ncbi:hypothetical protein L829_2093 [Mycobacteroides abscessus MAB_030201_1075]|uniref:Uncharacterized protein n=2 Tax=Mycobacteroides abscessus TaxID=36809 RepID=A0A829PHM3_9MYCO|nr:hypothetical protein MA3A0122R_1423 [Mycobacteroides abscessus 3A-0122-R]EIV57414.1 hypothetical protein MA3A0930R_1482 [Mycobacteroides abscessus 3A-0930-R]EIV67121.1 hypothetical protein MA4S0116S_0392 [Mycobacteroides abscessus 4S-0116-S]ETZ88534.1 hypothetical protein L829_2093 [Mycobacteroides abscessus MAB_030201_1075]EUA45398.1 hypothetical protein I543_1598 [Mycobacteroides abscessus 21]
MTCERTCCADGPNRIGVITMSSTRWEAASRHNVAAELRRLA